MFGQQFAATLLIPFVWLVVCKAIRKLRRRPRLCYVIASALVVATSVAPPNGVTPLGLLAGVIVLAILYFLYRRTLRKRSFDAATIISYEKPDMS
jgi:hypothetical protein